MRMTIMPVALLEWNPMERHSLRGFARIRIGKSLIMSDVTIHCNAGRRWASAPRKPLIGKDGTPVMENGKVKYVAVIEWADKEARNAFSRGVIEAVEREHPGTTSGDFAP
jgi:hypothetical protein